MITAVYHKQTGFVKPSSLSPKTKQLKNLKEATPNFIEYQPWNKRKDEAAAKFKVRRFGLDRKDSIDASAISAEKLDPKETQLLQSAFEELKKRQSFESYLSNRINVAPEHDAPKNVVLVDVFVRVPQNAKKEKGPAEIHTICLWRKSEIEFLLIDSNNSDLTSHFQRLIEKCDDLKQFGLSVKLHRYPKKKPGMYGHTKFYAPPPHLLGYTMGDQKLEYRDSIDVAIKIAYKLNKEQTIQSTNRKQTTQEAIDNVLEKLKLLPNQLVLNQPLKIDRIKLQSSL